MMNDEWGRGSEGSGGRSAGSSLPHNEGTARKDERRDSP